MSEQKMPLTPEMRQNYIDVIHKIWPRVMDRYNANDVTDEVVDMMDTILNSIAECSKAMEIIEEIYDEFYMPFKINKWRKIVSGALDVFEVWIKDLETHKRYQICITSAAWKWRSVMEMALMGL